MPKRFKFVIEFEVDKDMVPGFGYEVQHWIDFTTREFMRQGHYHPKIVIKEKGLVPVIKSP